MPIDTANASQCQAKQVRQRSQLTTIPFETAIRLQELLVKAAESETIAPAALAQIARAWSELEDRKRIIKMKPNPKPIDVTLRTAKPKRSAANGFSEVPSATPPLPQDKAKPTAG